MKQLFDHCFFVQLQCWSLGKMLCMAGESLNLAHVRHEPVFKQSDMETVNCPRIGPTEALRQQRSLFSQAKKGERGLLFVKESFDCAALCLLCTAGDKLFDNFEQSLSNTAEQHRANVADAMGCVTGTPAPF
jgi:hypothetical protein